MSFLRYERHRDSGIDWLGEIPEHWQLYALKRLALLQSGDSITAESINETGAFPVYGGNGLRGYAATYTHNGQHVLIGRQGALCGNINYAAGKFWASEHAVVVTPLRQVELRWLGELLRAMNLNQYSVSAAQPGLSVDAVGRLGIPVPPLPEQIAIAQFLHRETAKIDALVKEQQRLIELLKEKRQAVISDAVTKGIDPNAPMKASGVDWLGEVPEHWEVTQLRHVAREGTSITYGIVQAGPDIEGGIPYIRTSDMAGDQLPCDGYLRTSPEIDAAYARSKVSTGDVVIAIRATIGKPLITPSFLDGANLTQGTAKFSPGPSVLNEFIFYFLRSSPAVGQFERLGKGATFKEITLEMLRKFQVLRPPLNEQRQIADLLASKTAQLDRLISETKRAVALLQERRAGLISAAVTGKIDVRGLVQTDSPVPDVVAA
ncbi:restriction endonuclease subunit S [Bradyrhizobium sp. LCT2]|uniref:restriction endonuclease subunit S n=1 Tax=Bradyrhizobium sp. LCT2 TaxID=2493093 RepID=UPI001373B935|nr:restriction endonuclease subunit S [Bradyrhizobium sp. LCT2]QHP72173.1 restriction endonuclease subunit S [Bradyrhizobium sp. LCT2]